MTVESMLDVRIGEHVFRLTREEARRLRDMLTRGLGDGQAPPIVDAWPPVVLPPIHVPPLPMAAPWRPVLPYSGSGARSEADG